MEEVITPHCLVDQCAQELSRQTPGILISKGKVQLLKKSFTQEGLKRTNVLHRRHQGAAGPDQAVEGKIHT